MQRIRERQTETMTADVLDHNRQRHTSLDSELRNDLQPIWLAKLDKELVKVF